MEYLKNTKIFQNISILSDLLSSWADTSSLSEKWKNIPPVANFSTFDKLPPYSLWLFVVGEQRVVNQSNFIEFIKHTHSGNCEDARQSPLNSFASPHPLLPPNNPDSQKQQPFSSSRISSPFQKEYQATFSKSCSPQGQYWGVCLHPVKLPTFPCQERQRVGSPHPKYSTLYSALLWIPYQLCVTDFLWR